MRWLGSLIAAVAVLGLCGSAQAAAAKPPAMPKDSVIELQAGEGANRDLAIIISGDGGWADLDKQVGNRLVGRGTSVIGLDAYKYFTETRSPDDTARDVNAVLAYYLKAWNKDRLVLIGYSFGGAVMPFILNRMPDALRGHVALTVLLSTTTYANWEIHWGDWLHDEPHKSARPLAPELAKLGAVKMLCVYGVEEAEHSICPSLKNEAAEVLKLPGGHHFDENYVSLADQVLRRLPPQ